MEKKTLTVQEMAAAIQVSMPVAYQIVHREDFPKFRAGRKIVIPVHSFEAWLETQAKNGGDVCA